MAACKTIDDARAIDVPAQIEIARFRGNDDPPLLYARLHFRRGELGSLDFARRRRGGRII